MGEQADSFEFTPEQLEQHPVALLLLTLLGGLMVVICVGSLAMALYTIVRMAQGKPLLKVEPWTPRVWGLIDLILIAVLLVVAQTFSLRLWAQLVHFDLRQLKEEGDFPISAMAVGSLSYLVVMLLSIGWLGVRYGASLAHIGFTVRKFRSHIALGIGAGLLSLPVVYLVMGLVSTGMDQEYDHPLLRGMTEDGTLNAFLLGLFCAVIAAPISEEFLFRVLLQGWLQSIPFSWKRLWWFTGASEYQRGQIEAAETYALDQPASDTVFSASPANPYSPPVPLATLASTDAVRDEVAVAGVAAPAAAVTGAAVTGADAASSVPSQEDMPVMLAPPLWPVFVSGTLFGLAHWGYGLSFVPLILLGIILGFLYRATHSIWPGFVVHFMLNLIAITSLGIVTYIKALVQ